MTIEKRKSDGAIKISDIIDNQLITKTYIGFTEKESKSLFKRDNQVVSLMRYYQLVKELKDVVR